MGMSGAEQRVHFPVEAEVPESKRHLQLRTLLFRCGPAITRLLSARNEHGLRSHSFRAKTTLRVRRH